MPSTSRNILPTLLYLACAAGPLSAQDNQPADWQPVDQTVSDLDLRAASLRYVEQGIGVYGQSGSLYHRSSTDSGWMGLGQPLSQTYQLRQPGYTAYIDRPDYLVVDRQGEVRLNVAPSQDGRFQDLIPPNTVFDLVPRTQIPVTQYNSGYSEGWIDPYLSTRINGLVTGEPTVQPLLATPIAHRLPPHLIKAREERAAEATEAQKEAPQATDEPVEEAVEPEADSPER
jgi:hypothetical protein